MTTCDDTETPISVGAKGKFREFYDPNNYFETEDALREWVLERRTKLTEVNGLGKVRREGLLLAELTHLGLNTPDDTELAGYLGIDQELACATAEALTDHSYQTAQFCLNAVARIRHRTHTQTPTGTLAAAVLSANAHKGENRVNGGPYYYHPQSVAILIEAAWRRHFEPSETNDNELQRYQAVSLLHDAFEDTIRRDGSSFLSTEGFIASPLVIQQTMITSEAVSSQEARTITNDVLTLSKPAGIDGIMHYGAYGERIAEQPTAVPPKIADIHHNECIDPKIPSLNDSHKRRRVYAKRNQYTDVSNRLLNEYGSRAPTIRHALFVALIRQLSRDALNDARGRFELGKISEAELLDASTDLHTT